MKISVTYNVTEEFSKEELEKLPKIIDLPEYVDANDAEAVEDYVLNTYGVPMYEYGIVLDTWQRVPGGFTPGGDPAWKCPGCGRGDHVYGIENIGNPKHICPDCGIVLKYPWEEKSKA